MPIAAATIGAAIIGGGLAYAGSERSANAAQNIGDAQLAQAQRDRQLALQAGVPSTQELEQMAQQIELQNRAILRQEKLLAAIDPTILEAGAQALKLLRGEESRTLAPLRAERERQRQTLLNKLRKQLGTGAESSTTGLEALNRFDSETAGLMADKQQAVLGDLLKTTVSSRPNPYDATTANYNTLATLRAPRERLVSAINATPVTPYAGLGFSGAAVSGAGLSNLGAGLTQSGTQLATMQLLKGNSSSGLTSSEIGDMQQGINFLSPGKSRVGEQAVSDVP